MSIDRNQLLCGTVVSCDARTDWMESERLPVDDSGRFLAVVASSRYINRTGPSALIFPLLLGDEWSNPNRHVVSIDGRKFAVYPELARKHPFHALHDVRSGDAPVTIDHVVVKNKAKELFRLLTNSVVDESRDCAPLVAGQICTVDGYPFNDDISKSGDASVLVLSAARDIRNHNAALVARIRPRKKNGKGYWPAVEYPLVCAGRVSFVDAQDIAYLASDRLTPLDAGSVIAPRVVVKICAEMLMAAMFVYAHKELCQRFGSGSAEYSPELVAAAQGNRTYIPSILDPLSLS